MDDVARIAAEAYPPPTEPLPEARTAARARLLARAEARRRPRAARAGRPVVATVAVAIVVAALAVGVALDLDWPATDPARADAATVRALEAGAAAAEQQEPLGPLGPGRYVYTHSVGTYMHVVADQSAWLVRTDRRSWLAADGRVRLAERLSPVRLLAGDAAAWRVEAARLRALPVQITTAGAGRTLLDNLREAGVGTDVLTAHVDDPSGLADLLRDAAPRYGGQPTDQQMFTLVRDALRESLLPPDARAALFRATAFIPEVELVGEVTDERGRAGIAVAQQAGGIREEMVFDLATSALLTERSITTGVLEGLSGVPVGTVIGEAVYLESALVASPSVP